MTREPNYDRSVVNDLMVSAKEHCLESGYEKASLRKICSSAGVTTGALYFSFANKEALFDALVGPTLQKLDKVIGEVEQKVLKEGGKNFDANRFNDFIFQFLIDNKDGLRLLMTRAEGSQFENFAQKIHRYVEHLMENYARSVGGVEVDPELVSILTNMYFSAIADLISRDYSYEDMRSMAGALRICMEEGFNAMLRREQEKG
ncbi:MAG: TetR/AcrR family transcriptional regulator [Clostridia bacterium]|nr:TetR/AcrR family transcriptional regulator [Clostridia bacterium]